MSYKQFVTDLNQFYKDKSNSGTHYEIGQAIIRDIWLKNGRYDELIDFVLENWDSGNCDEFIDPLEKKLIAESHINRYIKLWSKIICYRLRKYIVAFENYFAEAGQPGVREIDAVDISRFNMFSVDSYKDNKNVLAFQRNFLLSGLQKYKNGLAELRQDREIEKVKRLEYLVTDMDKMKPEIKNWC